MRQDNELLAEVNRRLEVESELEAVNAKRFKSWRYSWFHRFNVLPGVKNEN